MQLRAKRLIDHERGTTLIELAIVMVIIAIALVAGIASLRSSEDEGKFAATKTRLTLAYKTATLAARDREGIYVDDKNSVTDLALEIARDEPSLGQIDIVERADSPVEVGHVTIVREGTWDKDIQLALQAAGEEPCILTFKASDHKVVIVGCEKRAD